MKAMELEDYIELFVTLLKEKGLFKEFLEQYELGYSYPVKMYFHYLDRYSILRDAVKLVVEPEGKWAEVDSEWRELIK